MKLELKYGYFVHWHHDLHGGLRYSGPFDTEEEAKLFAETESGYDEIYVLPLPYVETEEGVFALFHATKSITKNN